MFSNSWNETSFERIIFKIQIESRYNDEFAFLLKNKFIRNKDATESIRIL